MKVLVIDDEVIARTQLAAAVQRAGHIAFRASDGARGWAVLEDNPDIGLVVTDIGMPVMGGDELLRKIRASREHQRLPVIVVTAVENVGDHVRFRQIGANDLLVKPIRSDRVAEAIEATLKRVPTKPKFEVPRELVFNYKDLVTRLGGDHDLAREVIAAFIEEQGALWAEFERARETLDPAVIGKALHRIKGSLLNLGAPRTAAVAAEIELSPKSSPLQASAVQSFAAAMAELVAELKAPKPGVVQQAG